MPDNFQHLAAKEFQLNSQLLHTSQRGYKNNNEIFKRITCIINASNGTKLKHVVRYLERLILPWSFKKCGIKAEYFNVKSMHH